MLAGHLSNGVPANFLLTDKFARTLLPSRSTNDVQVERSFSKGDVGNVSPARCLPWHQVVALRIKSTHDIEGLCLGVMARLLLL
jgi:hypothetical protein